MHVYISPKDVIANCNVVELDVLEELIAKQREQLTAFVKANPPLVGETCIRYIQRLRVAGHEGKTIAFLKCAFESHK